MAELGVRPLWRLRCRLWLWLWSLLGRGLNSLDCSFKGCEAGGEFLDGFFLVVGAQGSTARSVRTDAYKAPVGSVTDEGRTRVSVQGDVRIVECHDWLCPYARLKCRRTTWTVPEVKDLPAPAATEALDRVIDISRDISQDANVGRVWSCCSSCECS